MEKESAYRTISKWIENSGEGIAVPDYLLALRECALTSGELDRQVFSVLKKKENDVKDWSLWAYHTIIPYVLKKEMISPEINNELSQIKTHASEQLGVRQGLNPWRYQLSYNPLQCIVEALHFLP